jgi:ABC-type nitrate/sulfonate/bicarbonate transport system permease component
MPRWLRGVAVLVALAALWELVSRLGLVHPVFFPPVTAILGTFVDMVRSGELPWQVLVSLRRATAGYVLAAAVFIPMGVGMALFPPVQRLVEVVVELLRPVPPPALVPVAIVFFGLEDAMKIFVIFLSCAWPILLNTIDGVRSIDRVLLHTASTFQLGRWATTRKIVVPAAVPQILTGLRISLGVTLILVVFSEMVGSADGIGYVVLAAQRAFQIPEMYAGMLALALLGWGLNALFLASTRRLSAWHDRANGHDPRGG